MKNRLAVPFFSACAFSLIIASQVRASPIVVNETTDSYGTNSILQSGIIDLPSGSTIGPGNSIEAVINFAGTSKTTTAYQSPQDIYVDVFGFSPEIGPGQQAFTVTYQLFDNGTAVTSPFGFSLDNPSNGSIYGIGGWGTTAPAGVAFNTLDVELTNTSQTVSVVHFVADIEAVPSSVPDRTATFLLLLATAAGLLLLDRLGRRLVEAGRQKRIVF